MVPRAAGRETAAGSGVNMEEIAAISLALELYRDDFHDKEPAVITFDRAERHSPWNSKVFGLRETPKKIK